MKKKIAILGSTGFIGKNTIGVLFLTSNKCSTLIKSIIFKCILLSLALN